MPDTEPLIAELVEASSFAHCGLAAFDTVMARLDAEEIDRASRRMRKAGHGQDDIDAFAAVRLEATRQMRGELHRKLWAEALPRYVTALSLRAAFGVEVLPASIIGDLIDADRYVHGGAKVVDDINETGLARLRTALAKHGTDAEKAEAESEIAEFRERFRQDRRKLLAKLWAGALPCIAPAATEMEA